MDDDLDLRGQRNPKQRPESLFALQHYSYLAMVQCGRVEDAALACQRVDNLHWLDIQRREANHLWLGERFFLLCAGREVVRALDAFGLGRLPGRMHDDLTNFRNAISHWDGWGKGKDAERKIHEDYPEEWPYQVSVLNGEFLVGGSLKVSDIYDSVERLYEWTRDPSKGHGLEVPPDLTTHEVMLTFDSEKFFPMVRALRAAEFKVGGGNNFLWVSLESASRATTVRRVARRIDPQAVMGEPRPRTVEDDDEG
jgi:hypothetical protein